MVDYSFEDLAILPENRDKVPDPLRFKRRLKYIENLANQDAYIGNLLALEIRNYLAMCAKLDLTDW